jgi:polyhydroxyalkanoate synthesis regulator phasin
MQRVGRHVLPRTAAASAAVRALPHSGATNGAALRTAAARAALPQVRLLSGSCSSTRSASSLSPAATATAVAAAAAIDSASHPENATRTIAAAAAVAGLGVSAGIAFVQEAECEPSSAASSAPSPEDLRKDVLETQKRHGEQFFKEIQPYLTEAVNRMSKHNSLPNFGFFTETKESNESALSKLMDHVADALTGSDVANPRKRIRALRRRITGIQESITQLLTFQATAFDRPTFGFEGLPFLETKRYYADLIREQQEQIASIEAEIRRTAEQFQADLRRLGMPVCVCV